MEPMARKSGRRMHGAGAWITVCWLGAVATGAPVGAQELDFLRERPGAGATACEPAPARTTSSSGRRSSADGEADRQVAQLTSSADQALILGDIDRAEALLRRATDLDPSSAELAYRHARLLEDLGDVRGASAAYCRAIAMAADEEGFRDAEARLDALVLADGVTVPAPASAAFDEGLEAAEHGDWVTAADRFRTAGDLAPNWAAAERNYGVALARQGRRREAATALERYLDLRPDAPDALAVSRRVGQLQSLAVRTGPSPVVAGALGVLVPGMGQIYTGRSGPGLSMLGIAVGAAAAGFLVKEIDVRCLVSVEPGEGCPEGQVVSRRTRRPYLPAAIGVAAVLTVAGAVEAFLEARAQGSGDAAIPPRVATHRAPPDRPLLMGPALASTGGRVDLRVIGLRLP